MGIKKQEIRHAVEKKLGLTPHVGSENNAWYYLDGRKIIRFTYPKGSGELNKKTLARIRVQSDLNWDDFTDLIKCPMSATDFEKIIRDKIRQKLL